MTFAPKCVVLGELQPDAERNLTRYPPLLRRLLFNRGIRSSEEAERFINLDYAAQVRDPFLMKDIERAVVRILRGMQNAERIAIWSDYDADGIPGAVVLRDFFKKLGYGNFENYIPDRHAEGFGLNAGALEQLARRRVALLITVDCGTTDTEEVARAKELGMDVIITDHHLPNGSLPPACAILNPKQPDCPYPEKMLCGSGVAFKLVQGLLAGMRREPAPAHNVEVPAEGWEKWLLDMVGIATLSDMVPLTGENRALAHYGLMVLRKSPRIGLSQLLRELRINRSELTEDDVGFSITPRINAASRMGHPRDAFQLFATSDGVEAGVLARHLNRINDERKGKVAALVKEARRIVEERYAHESPRVVVAGNPRWRPALLGLVANALVEDYGKPVFIWGREGGAELKGSCRSDGTVDVTALMQEVNGVFLDFGGHRDAGGFSVALEKLHLLEEELERAYERARSASESAAPQYRADARLSLADITWALWRDISKLAPFGVGNPKPLFLFEGLPILAALQFGREKQHLKLVFEKGGGERLSAVKFYAKPEDFGGISQGQSINLLAHLERFVFRDFPELRLRIVDVSPDS